MAVERRSMYWSKVDRSESLISQTFCKRDQSDQIVFGQIPGQLFQFANQLRFFDVGIEEFLGGDTEIIAKAKKFGEGRQGFAGGDALNIAFAMAQIQAHFVFRNTFLYAQLRNPISYKEFIHNAPHLSFLLLYTK